MSRNVLNFIVDGLLLLATLALTATGGLMWLILPPGSGHSGQALWGLNRHGWGEVHLYLAIAAIALGLLHVILHWQWVCRTVTQMATGSAERTPHKGGRTVYGVLTVIVVAALVVGFLWLAHVQVTTGPGGGRQGGQGHGGGRHVELSPEH